MSQKGRISLSQAAALDGQLSLLDAIDQAKEAARTQALRDQVSIAVAKQRKNSQRKNAADEGPLGPTPERAAKEAEGMVKIVPPIDSGNNLTSTRTHRALAPHERYQSVIPSDMLAAAVQAVTDILTAESGARITGSYGEAMGGVYGARHGGVHDYVREKASIVTEMRATLDPEFMKIIDDLLIQRVVDQTGRPVSLADTGRRMSPWAAGHKGENDTKVGFGALWVTLARLREFYQQQRALGKQPIPASPDAVRRLLTAGAARVQRMREQHARKKGER